MRTIISYYLLITLTSCATAWGQYQANTMRSSPPDSLAITSNTFVALQLGGNSYHEFAPSATASVLFKVAHRLWVGPFYERLIGSFHDHYPAVWVTSYTYPNEYGSETTTTGPIDGNYDFYQNIIGISGLLLASNSDQAAGFYLGGGVGMYTGTLTRKPILTAPATNHSFNKAIGFQLLSALRFSITNKIGLIITAKYHNVTRELDLVESSYVTLDYDAYGGVIRECRGDVCTYYSNEYAASGLLMKKTAIQDVGKLSGTYNNFAVHAGIFFKIN